jgi:hypothetical protein
VLHNLKPSGYEDFLNFLHMVGLLVLMSPYRLPPSHVLSKKQWTVIPNYCSYWSFFRNKPMLSSSQDHASAKIASRMLSSEMNVHEENHYYVYVHDIHTPKNLAWLCQKQRRTSLPNPEFHRYLGLQGVLVDGSGPEPNRDNLQRSRAKP